MLGKEINGGDRIKGQCIRRFEDSVIPPPP